MSAAEPGPPLPAPGVPEAAGTDAGRPSPSELAAAPGPEPGPERDGQATSQPPGPAPDRAGTTGPAVPAAVVAAAGDGPVVDPAPPAARHLAGGPASASPPAEPPAGRPTPTGAQPEPVRSRRPEPPRSSVRAVVDDTVRAAGAVRPLPASTAGAGAGAGGGPGASAGAGLVPRPAPRAPGSLGWSVATTAPPPATAQAVAASGRYAPPPLAPPERPAVTASDVAGLLLISAGAFLAPIVAPVLGLLLLWRSGGWRRPDKGAATAVVALPVVVALGVVAIDAFLRVWRF